MIGATLVASANTICSCTVLTLPQLAASCSVEEEQAPSRTSATVICTAYLCTSTSSWPRISAQTTVSCAKFFGTPPPTMKRAVVPTASLISVSSRKSPVASAVDGDVRFLRLAALDLVLDDAEAGRAIRERRHEDRHAFFVGALDERVFLLGGALG